MAFPTTGLLDQFNRANENPVSDGGAWSSPVFVDHFGLNLVTNRVEGRDFLANSYRNTATYGPDWEVYATAAAIPASGVSMRLYGGLVSPGTAGVDGYGLYFLGLSTLRVVRIDNGSATTLGADIALTLVAAEKLGLERVGSTLNVYHFTGGAWSLIATRTDSTYTAAGYIGAFCQNAAGPAWDDFGGGTIVATTPAQTYDSAISIIETELWFPLTTKGADNSYLDTAVRISSPGASASYYRVRLTVASGVDTADIYRVAAGVETLLASAQHELTAGDFVAVTCRNDASGNPVITCWYWDGTDTWVSLVAHTDTAASAALKAAGAIGFEATAGSAWSITTLNGGSLAASSATSGGAGLGHVYAVTIDGVPVSAALDLFAITPADDRTCRVVACYLSQSSDVGSAEEEMLRVELIRGHTVAGSGGSASTPVPMNASDGDASFTARTLDTTIASGGTPVVLHSEAFNVRTGWRYEPDESERPGVKETNTTLVVRLMAAPSDPVTVSATLLVEEF